MRLKMCVRNVGYVSPSSLVHYKSHNCKKNQFKRQCKGQTYKTTEIILLCHKVMCLFRTEPCTCDLVVKSHSLRCHYKSTITNTSHTCNDNSDYARRYHVLLNYYYNDTDEEFVTVPVFNSLLIFRQPLIYQEPGVNPEKLTFIC